LVKNVALPLLFERSPDSSFPRLLLLLELPLLLLLLLLELELELELELALALELALLLPFDLLASLARSAALLSA
jgi:hypothetical protein